MLLRLKIGLIGSEIQRKLSKANIDKTSTQVDLNVVDKIVETAAKNKRLQNQLFNFLYKNINSEHNTFVVKCLIVLHSCTRKMSDDELQDFIMGLEIKNVLSLQKNSEKQQYECYYIENVINYYILYLKKMCVNKESIDYIKKCEKTLFINCFSDKNVDNVEIVAHGFKILNFSHFIIKSQQTFNKMGRYHIENSQMFSMYIQFLEDLNFYNHFLKSSVHYILKKNKGNENFSSLSKKKNLDSILVVQNNNNHVQFQEKLNTNQIEQTKHDFLFVYQSQKIFDLLYEFYHVRYYLKKLRGLINFPSFLTIGKNQYKQLRDRAKSVDKNMVRLVSRSKYSNQKSVNLTFIQTEPSLNQSTKSWKHSRNLSLTQTDNIRNSSFDYDNQMFFENLKD